MAEMEAALVGRETPLILEEQGKKINHIEEQRP
jgi:hypothetical protein